MSDVLTWFMQISDSFTIDGSFELLFQKKIREIRSSSNSLFEEILILEPSKWKRLSNAQNPLP